MGSQSLTATELAYCANISRSTASGHLGKLVAAGLLTVTHKRRFSYYRIASPLIAAMLESMKVDIFQIEFDKEGALFHKRTSFLTSVNLS